MNTLILSLHVIVCITLVILVLLQSGKEGMGVIFGGGNSSVFGSSGAGGILAKLTAFVAILFVGTCLSYNLLTSSKVKQDSTILDIKLEDAAPAMPAVPEAPKAPATPAVPDTPKTPEAPAAAETPGTAAPEAPKVSEMPATPEQTAQSEQKAPVVEPAASEANTPEQPQEKTPEK